MPMQRADAHLHRHVVAPARRQDADRPRAHRIFLRAQTGRSPAFDVNPDEFKLIDYLPAYTAAASINDTRGEMALFDQLVLPDRVPKVVDLSHTLFDKFFTLMQQIDFAREAQRRGVAPMVLFVADPDDRARQGYTMLMDRFPDLPLVPVLNEAIRRSSVRRQLSRRPGAAARRSPSRRCRRCCAR